MEKLSTALLSSTSQSSLSMSVAASGSLINGHDERDFEDKKVSHMKQKRRITAAANDNVQKREELRWREGARDRERERGGIKIEPRELKRWGEADGLRTVANFGNYCDSHADFERVCCSLTASAISVISLVTSLLR